MATDIKVVLGYVEQQQVRGRGGRSATRASNIKSAAAERLAGLVDGTAVGRGVENTDDMKAGHLTPAIRMDILKARIGGLDARITGLESEAKVLAAEGATPAKLWAVEETTRALRARRERAVGELVDIMRGMAEAE